MKNKRKLINYPSKLVKEYAGLIFIDDIYEFSEGEKTLEKIYNITEKNISQEEYANRIDKMYDNDNIPLEIRYSIIDDNSCDNYCTPGSYIINILILRSDTNEEITQYFDTEKIYDEFIKNVI